LWSWSESPACSINVIYVDIGGIVHELLQKFKAFWSGVLIVWTSEITLSSLNLFIKTSVHKRVPVCHLNIGWFRIIGPVGDSVSNSESLNVWLEDVIVFSIGFVVLDDVVSHVWNIDSSI